jgi:hypothetical protein
MKANRVFFPVIFLLLFSSCSEAQFGGFGSNGTIKNLGKAIGVNTGNSNSSFTQSEAAQAIKEALSNGITKGVDKVSVADGYFKNAMIKILLPPEAQQAETALRGIGMSNLVDEAVARMNHAAEDAAKKATPIFLNAIQQMTVNDAINIVNNKQQDAATKFLQRTTTEQLVAAFKPSIKEALDKSLATKYWADMTNAYNEIPFVEKINTDLPDYVTRKAITGLFYMIAQEEAQIRKDPVARTTEILRKVFGNVKL